MSSLLGHRGCCLRDNIFSALLFSSHSIRSNREISHFIPFQQSNNSDLKSGGAIEDVAKLRTKVTQRK
jgi:hypothetical protein